MTNLFTGTLQEKEYLFHEVYRLEDMYEQIHSMFDDVEADERYYAIILEAYDKAVDFGCEERNLDLFWSVIQ